MKKILYLVTQSEFGGAQKYIFDLTVNLPSHNCQAIVAAGDGDGELFNRLAASPMVKTVKLFNLKRSPGPSTVWRCLKETIELLTQEKPNVLHLNSSAAGFLGSWAAKIYKKKTKANLKVIYTVHGWSFLEPGFLKSAIYLLLEKISSKFKDIFIILSEKDKQAALKYKISPLEKIVKIYNGIDSNKLKFLEKNEAKKAALPLSWRAKSPLIGSVANLYSTKGIRYLIEAIHLLKKQGENIFLALIGEGPERKNLEKQIIKYNLKENVLLLGRISQANQYLKMFDIFVLPSVKEGFPFVILEAMLAGLPIIATNVGAIPEILENEKSALLVEPKNPKALAQTIAELLNNPEKQKNLAENARQEVKKFSLAKTLSQTYSLY